MGLDLQKELQSFLKEKLDTDVSGDIPLIPTGIDVLDLLLGGGIGLGTFAVSVGYSGSFKSTLAIEVAKGFKKYNPDSLVIYIDNEASMTSARLKQIGLEGVEPLIGITVEGISDTVDTIIAWKEQNDAIDLPVIIIWDSIANTPSEADLKAKSVNETIGVKARVLSSLLPKLLIKLHKYNITLYAINQFRDKVQIGFVPSPSDLKHMQHDKTMPGGNAVMFNASHIIEHRVVEHKVAEESKYGFRHAVVELKTVKNKFFPDGYKMRLVIDVANGVDNVYTNFELLSQYKRITVGAWNYLKSYPSKKFRTKELREIYNKDEEFRKAFDNEVKALINELKAKMSNMSAISNEPESDNSTEDINNET